MSRPAAVGDGEPLAGVKRTNAVVVPLLALNVEQACAALGVSWDTWREHIEPHVRLVRIGSRKLVAVAELERWLEETAERTVASRRRRFAHR